MKQAVKKYSGWSHLSLRQKLAIKKILRSVGLTLVSIVPLSISRLFGLFGSDKEEKGAHHYGATYGKLLRPLRYRPLKLLEIGTANGASMKAWEAYFPFARIVGCDIMPNPEMATWRTRIYKMDQSSASDAKRLCEVEGPFDVVIDDGSHLSAHQIATFRRLFPAVSDGGLYVIEDVQTSFWPLYEAYGIKYDGRHIDDPEFSKTCVGYFLELAKYLNHEEFTDQRGVDPEQVTLARTISRISFEHNLVIIERRSRGDAPGYDGR